MIPYQKFKMEGLKNVKEMLQKNDYMVKIDLKDAFFNVALNKQSQHLVRFQWKGNLYQFLSLCFGISPAPRIFTKIMKIPISILRRLNIRVVIYLDDIILLGRTLKEIKIARETTIYLLQHLGFVINLKKSCLDPSREMEYLGVLINSLQMTLFLPEIKVTKIIKMCQKLTKAHLVTLRELSSLIGTLVSTAPAILPAPLQYRFLQHQVNLSLAKCPDYDKQIYLNPQSKTELQWWIHNLQAHNGRAIQILPPHLILTSDAAKKGGWGASCQGESTGGQWNQDEQSLHINVQELLAAKYALRCFLKDKRDLSIHMMIDNTTALSYLVKMGGTKNLTMTKISKSIWHFLLKRNLTLTAEWIPSQENKISDWESRYI